MKQLTFPLCSPRQKHFANFSIGENQLIVNALQQLTPPQALYLWGKPSSGCSHLLQACCSYWQQRGSYALYVDMRQTTSLKVLLEGALDNIALIALDHLEAALGNQENEELLFHLFNRSQQSPFASLWAAQNPPTLLKIKLADLQSRLKSCLIFHLQEANDQEKKLILQEHAKQLGFNLQDDAARFMITHYTRQLDQLLDLLDQLGQASLQTHKSLTIPFIKKFIK